MTKVAVFIGSARKKHTYEAVQELLSKLKTLGPIEPELVFLHDYNLKQCIGCMSCLDRGEERCPLRDDRDALIAKIDASDAVIMATPNYSFQVSAVMKNFLDRIAFCFHRPRFFGKTFTNIVVQGIFGGNKIVRYLDFIGGSLGFNAVSGCCLASMEPMTAKARRKNTVKLERLARRLHGRLSTPALRAPSLFKLMVFRMSRTGTRQILSSEYKDFRYYQEMGWFVSDYYYPVRLGALKRLLGRMCDFIAASTAKKREVT